MKKKTRRPALVLVEWNDAASSNPGWLKREEIVKWGYPNCLIHNVGYVIQRTPRHLLLASRRDTDKEHPWFGLLQRIPAGMIRRVWRLREPK